MNKKAQLGMVGVLIGVFMTVIIGIALFNGGITSNVAGVTNTYVYNTSGGHAVVTYTTGIITALEGKSVTNFLAINETGGEVIAAGNYTIANNQILNNELTATINASGDYSGNTWNVSYTFEPVGYITSAGGRSLAALVIIFTALAIGIVALVPVLKSDAFNMFR